MKLLLTLLPWCKNLSATPRVAEPADTMPMEEPDAADDAPGCGWFDSSHELQHGLVVQEHAAPEALAAALPLVQWLDLHLANWQPASPQPA